MENIIEIHNLHKKLGGKTVIDHLNLNLIKGETFVLIGQSGMGKSVLIKHLIGLIPPDDGQIIINGTEMDFQNENQWKNIRKNLGILFQGGALFDSMTVGQNVLFPLDHLRKDLDKQEKLKMMKEALELVELQGTADQSIASLSGGMKKRAALARAIVFQPSIVFFDEPTSGLDPITTATINQLIIHIKEKLKTTFLVVTHDLSSALTIADRIGMIYEGQLIFSGDPSELKTNTNPYIQKFITGNFQNVFNRNPF